MHHLFGGLVYKFQPEMFDSGVAPSRQMLARLLRFCAKDRVAATHIRHDGMGTAVRITQCDSVLLARVATVFVARSVRQKAAEHAVLGMKNRQVLVCNDFESV